ncbi:Uncharacterized conserved protein UCP033563 [Candidatus Magnetomorum sp. HK-1]|nr:Uncharacterized conserved protein UCP033563 [Candidatus Magnetomorum sp. HK-1]
MATVVPFKGIRYNTEKLDIAQLVTPPYDVISEEEQESYYACHPQNIIRLILGKHLPTDDNSENRYTRAAECYSTWQSKEYLKRDESPTLYFTAMDFSVDDKVYTRYGLIALVKLERFETGVVKPHEKTFTNVKSERLKLMTSCHANFSPIFALYPDTDHEIFNTLLEAVENVSPEIEFVDSKNETHRLWPIIDPKMHEFVEKAMGKKSIFIADGHHRYETALQYLSGLEQQKGTLAESHPAQYIMMYLTSMEDPGLVILPAHRQLTTIPDQQLNNFLNKLSQYFDIKTLPFDSESKPSVMDQFIRDLNAGQKAHTLGAYYKNHSAFVLLTLKPGILDAETDIKLPLRYLDVTLLTQIIFERILDFDQSTLDNEKQITYTTSIEQAVSNVDQGKCDMVMLLNPTQIEQVQDVANAGLTMPRKSTYFYPKVITGLVLNDLLD